MTDINEAIARWMGWKRSIDHPRDDPPHAKCDCWTSPHGEHFDGPPAYTSSLDAQVPVWEAGPLAFCEIAFSRRNNGLWDVEVCDAFSKHLGTASGYELPAVAIEAIHAALVAIGEIDA